MGKRFDLLAKCIQLESEAEARRFVEQRKQRQNRNEEATGDTLLGLTVNDSEPTLGGRYLITLSKRNRTQALPWNRLRAGTPVVVSSQEEGSERTGVVSHRTTHQVQVAVNSWIDGEPLRIDRSPDEVTRKRQLAALTIAAAGTGRIKQLREIMFAERDPEFGATPKLVYSTDLNRSQQQAVEFAMSAHDLAIVHGPPGTGKTTTVAELIYQAVAQDELVLACAPSNTAVDNLLLRLARMELNVVRLGHPARVSRELHGRTLDALVERDEHIAIAKELTREAEAIFRKLDRHSRKPPRRGARQAMRAEAKQRVADARRLERQAIESVLDHADVICMTTTGDDDLLRDRRFDLVVIDEACQSTEPGCWIPLLRADRIVLAGDHCQLPPTVLSAEAVEMGFDVSLMQRLIQLYDETVTRRLDVQYRMHEMIMSFSSREFYDNGLIADPAVARHTLEDLEHFSGAEHADFPAEFIDTAGSGWEEHLEPDGQSKLNPDEGRLILKKARELVESGLRPHEIAVIAPYAAQVRWIRDHCDVEDLEIDTVDGFQGREKEAVLITLVRSNSEAAIGFLADQRRMNVALTRAKRKLIVVGDSATLGSNAFFRRLLDFFEQVGGYRSVWEEME